MIDAEIAHRVGNQQTRKGQREQRTKNSHALDFTVPARIWILDDS
jgi:hypothetical protein